jgi:hypothetical protein
MWEMGERKSGPVGFSFLTFFYYGFSLKISVPKVGWGGCEFKECESGLQEGGAKVSETVSKSKLRDYFRIEFNSSGEKNHSP